MQKRVRKILSRLQAGPLRKDYMDCFEKIRIEAVLPLVKGELLDVGCGYNNLVQLYQGDGIGVDVYNWGGKPDKVIKRSDNLPFEDKSFDTITFVACLNHIPYRVSALKEARRVLKDNGKIIITMIGPLTGKLAHLIEGKDEKQRDGFKEGELMGISDQHLDEIFDQADFKLVEKKRIMHSPNKIYILKKQ